jgi:hypothetical protein
MIRLRDVTGHSHNDEFGSVSHNTAHTGRLQLHIPEVKAEVFALVQRNCGRICLRLLGHF